MGNEISSAKAGKSECAQLGNLQLSLLVLGGCRDDPNQLRPSIRAIRRSGKQNEPNSLTISFIFHLPSL